MDKASYLCFALLLVSLSPVQVKAGWSWTDIALAGVAGTAAVVAAPAFLTAAGFTSAGVAAGSFAAAAQSTYGGYVASGSLFAASQSAGAVGIGVKTATTIFAAAGGATLYAKEK
ncbi:Interferon-induced 6-16 [Desmophyllum pertusum]|uniref:Interferon-induced 6-16 n=1 Tax=Desmophyllum pertusum TaxID=174260 RepID=A0A9X0D390_9CNID|nr:Interferon-induced 6-16 [Desmophyllum pertusum]